MPRITLRAALVAAGVITPYPDDYVPTSASEPDSAAVLSIGEVYGYEAVFKPRAALLSKQLKRKRNV